MAEARIQILIPTYNHVSDLDATMESIWNQNYNPANIYVTIVDFGSEDGTYEKAMSYPKERLGVYVRPFQKNWRQRLADAARLLGFVHPGGLYCYTVVLYPGDLMYPDCLKILTESYIENFHLNLSMALCESDIFTEDGNIQKQEPLFSKDRIIDGSKELSAYIKSGYKHQIFQMTPGLSGGRYKANYENNEGRCWNKLARRNNERMAVYIKEPLVCTKRISYEDELQEILYRWEASISIVRFYSNKYGCAYDDEFVRLANENLAEYALWRSFCLYQKGAGGKEMEDCFLIAGVIASSVKEKEIYKKMARLVMEKDSRDEAFIEEYFCEQG